MPAAVARSRVKKVAIPAKGRVLIEFSEALLQRADEAARTLNKNRSELIRDAVVEKLEALEARKFEAELAAAYAANAARNSELAEEFAYIDSEGL